MNRLQQIQALGNCLLSIIGFSSFIILVNYIRLTKSSCSNNAGIYAAYDCNAYHSFQCNAAFSFFLIFTPWVGMLGSLKGKKIIVYIYLILLAIILLAYLITFIIIFSNQDVRDLWRLARNTDSIDISAVLEGLLTSYNMLIAQIVLVWFFLVGTGIVTFAAVKKSENEGINEPLK